MVHTYFYYVTDEEVNPTCYQFKGPFVLIYVGCEIAIFKAITHMAPNYICLKLRRHSKSWFPQMNHPIIAEENSTNISFSFSENIGRLWYDQVICIKNSFFGNIYGMIKAPLLWVGTSTWLAKHPCGGYSVYEISSDDIP